MSIIDKMTRQTKSRLGQQALRYYAQSGWLGLVSKSTQFTMTDLLKFDIDSYLDKRCLSRDDIFESLSDDKFMYYHSDEEVQIGSPIHPGPIPKEFRNRVGTCQRERPFVCELRDIDITGPTANVKTADGKYVPEAQGTSNVQLFQSILIEEISRVGPSPPADNIDLGVVFDNSRADNYAHWVMDFLPRLKGVEEYIEQANREPTIIIGAEPPDWKLDYLEIFGYESGNIFQYDGGKLHIDRLVVPYGKRYKLSLIEWVRDRVLENIDIDAGNYPSNIYISRDDALCRRVINERELMELLYNEGFAKVELSKMSLENAIRLFVQAEKIIAPHGAGLADIIYSDDVSIIELYGAKHKPCFFHLAEILGHRYGCVPCVAHGEDLIANIDQIEEMIQQV
ncbi:glycosyltransferase family 61 protein [Haloarcula litorea]|uniref:glycosyltransferase family 61 protein n=1 Tax=Haloarcula litorea TaxID=3032579 RepID=UPI0023E79C98|nr:glycosyltransferase family 61 protein [Halomicroarcula sp. GDY20]